MATLENYGAYNPVDC